jgi:hypothetical protein
MEAIRAGVMLPPVVVFRDRSGKHYLADGWHRLEAAERLGMDSFQCRIVYGEWREALLYAAGANEDHGLRRTPQDRRRAVAMLLADEEIRRWSTRRIAKAAKVSFAFAERVIAEQGVERPEARVGLDGKERHILDRAGAEPDCRPANQLLARAVGDGGETVPDDASAVAPCGREGLDDPPLPDGEFKYTPPAYLRKCEELERFQAGFARVLGDVARRLRR